MNDAERLALVRAVHTAIYMVLTASTFVVLYSGLSGRRGAWLWPAVGLLGIECAVFIGNGFKCPLSGLASRYGAEPGLLFDTFLPERMTRYTLAVFGPLIAIGFVLLLARWRGLIATAS